MRKRRKNDHMKRHRERKKSNAVVLVGRLANRKCEEGKGWIVDGVFVGVIDGIK